VYTHGTLEGTGMDLRYRNAKVEHYLDRAQDYFNMARYLAAKQPLDRALTLDPQNQAGRILLRSIEQSISSIANDDGSVATVTVRQSRPRRSELIVLIDQDERVLEGLTSSLRKYGFTVVSAGSYHEAVELLSFATPQLILSEVNLYLWVRTNSRLQHIPFLFLSTRVDRQTLIAGKRLGVNDFILKPVDDDLVYASIVSCLGRGKQVISGG
jgi:CheY-like chemotaxis protein